MSFDILVEKLRSAYFVPFPNQYYVSVLRQIEPLMQNLTNDERARLKDHLVHFVLKWYKQVNEFPPGGPDPTDPNALAEFVHTVKEAGYDYPEEWGAFWKSHGPYKSD